jgi:hypothetical protein
MLNWFCILQKKTLEQIFIRLFCCVCLICLYEFFAKLELEISKQIGRVQERQRFGELQSSGRHPVSIYRFHCLLYMLNWLCILQKKTLEQIFIRLFCCVIFFNISTMEAGSGLEI